MYIDIPALEPRARYGAMTNAIVPRPIAWILTDNGEDSLSEDRWNLAPFSYFNGASVEPPQIVMSIGHALDNSYLKDTYLNLLETPECVIHIPSVRHVVNVERSAHTYPRGESELRHLGLETVPFDGWPIPRLQGVSVALACRANRFLRVGTDEEQILVTALVESIYVDDDVTRLDHKGRTIVDLLKLDPAGRAGSGQYVGIRDPFTVDREPLPG
jgi:flavin reductase (DIM6/NTAB) family NADH-FMN oxidoreductase RutF